MKILEKIALIIYSYIILLISVLLCVLVFGWVDMKFVGDIIQTILVGETSSKIVLGVSIVFILLSIRCIFFDKTSKEQIHERQGVLLENENGKLMISTDTIENLVSTVAKQYKTADEITTSVDLDKENNVIVYVNLVVSSEAVIKDLSANLQQEIKEKIKKATDLEVKQVNIKVKNIASSKEEKSKK